MINLLGEMTLNPFESPFLAADRLVEEALRETPVVVVDFHAEATSEKIALAYYLDGRATAVLGTHTHVQTNDARVLAGGHGRGHGRGDDGPARLGDREPSGRPDQAVHDGPAGAARGRRRTTCGSRASLVECGVDGRATSCELVRVSVEAD